MAIDLRTRRDGEQTAVEPRFFLDVELPSLFESRVATVAASPETTSSSSKSSE